MKDQDIFIPPGTKYMKELDLSYISYIMTRMSSRPDNLCHI